MQKERFPLNKKVGYHIASKMNEKMLRFILSAIAIAIVSLLLFIYINLFVRPSGPYEPLASVPFFFDVTGVEESITFNPMLLRNHELAVVASEPFDVSENFRWKVEAKVYRFGIKIDEKILNIKTLTFLSNKNLSLCDEISFQWIRTLDYLPGRATVKLSVLNGDKAASKYKNNFQIVVRPSGYK